MERGKDKGGDVLGTRDKSNPHQKTVSISFNSRLMPEPLGLNFSIISLDGPEGISIVVYLHGQFTLEIVSPLFPFYRSTQVSISIQIRGRCQKFEAESEGLRR